MGIDETASPEGASGRGSSIGVEGTGNASSEADQRAEHAGPRESGDVGGARGERESAETRTRQEYADHMRAHGQPLPSGDDPRYDAAEASAPESNLTEQPANVDHDLAEPRDRETYADIMRAARSDPGHQDAVLAVSDDPAQAAFDALAGTSTRATGQQRAESLSREEYADAMRDGGPGIDDSEQPDTAAPGAGDTDSQATTEKRGPARHDARQVSFDGKEIDVTSNAADGIWIEGLPGEAPDRVGNVLASPDEQKSRAENLRNKFYENADGIFDAAEKTTNRIDQIFQRPPTHTIVSVPESAHHMPESAHEAADVGHLAVAGLMLGVLAFEASRRIRDRIGQGRGT